MLLKRVMIPTKSMVTNTVLQARSFHKSTVVLLDDRWRAKCRLHPMPNAFGPLTDMPDYSFKDGRPAPFGVKQMVRINKQRQIFTNMKKLTGEIDYAVERHARLEEEKARERQSIIDKKLKPKGHLL